MTSGKPTESDCTQSSSELTVPSTSGNVAIRTLSTALAGIACALLSWKAIELIGEVFVLPPDLAALASGQAPPPDVQAKVAAVTRDIDIKNAAIWMGTAGAILGILFGLTLCLCRRLGLSSIRMILVMVVSGTLSGAVAGVAGYWINAVSRQNMAAGATSPPEQFTLLVHSATWMIVGLGIGMGIAMGGRRSGRSRIESMVVIGLVGMVGGCLFPIVAGILLPTVNSTWPIPPLEPAAGRILWLSLPSVLMGLAIGRNG
ncbi:MAG: hypothetical protein WKF77_12345 [Planctomycetaceae bacterium]